MSYGACDSPNFGSKVNKYTALGLIVAISGCLWAAMFIAGCASGTAPRGAAAGTTVQAKLSGAECHMERPTGSLLTTRVCLTEAERARVRQNVQEVADEIKSAVDAACPPQVPCQ
jgi:hypothetical protein